MFDERALLEHHMAPVVVGGYRMTPTMPRACGSAPRLASQLKLFDRLDQWLRRRIRMCYWKQWRRPRKRRRELMRLGVPRRQAIRHARSRKGHWHMAKTIASGVGLNNAWLQDRGLLSMKTLWAKLAPLRRTA